MVSAAPSDRNLFEEGSGTAAPACKEIRQANQLASHDRRDHPQHAMERAWANTEKKRWPGLA